MSKSLYPVINVDVKMPRKMLNALNIYEVNCVCRKVDRVTEEEVKAFLADRFGDGLASQFKPEYLFSAEDRATPSS